MAKVAAGAIAAAEVVSAAALALRVGARSGLPIDEAMCDEQPPMASTAVRRVAGSVARRAIGSAIWAGEPSRRDTHGASSAAIHAWARGEGEGRGRGAR